MSSQTIANQISRLHKEIERHQRDLARVSKDEAAKSKRIGQIHKSITKNTSDSSIRSKNREIERLNDQSSGLKSKRADLTKKIADKTAKLHQAEKRLSESQRKEQKKMTNSLERAERDRKIYQSRQMQRFGSQVESQSSSNFMNESSTEYDAFVCHASEDKDELVRPLAESLIEEGLTIWFDEFELSIGDSLRRSIDKGLSNSRFGIVVLSPDFFAKNWPQYELDGLVEKEMQGGKVILPVWHHVSKNDVMNYSPSLADKFALSTSSYTIEELSLLLVKTIRTI